MIREANAACYGNQDAPEEQFSPDEMNRFGEAMGDILAKGSEPDPNQRLAQEMLAQAGGTTTKPPTRREVKAAMKKQQTIKRALDKGASAK